MKLNPLTQLIFVVSIEQGGELANFLAAPAPAPDFFFQGAPAPAPDIFPKRLRLFFLSSSGSKGPKPPSSD